MMYYINGDLMLAKEPKIKCHQVNCQGKMGAGIAKIIRDVYPKVYTDYMNHLRITPSRLSLGTITYTTIEKSPKWERAIINMFAQNFYGIGDQRYTDYEAFYNCLSKIYNCAVAYQTKYGKAPIIGFPYKIGCGLGGGNWAIISAMIETVLAKDFDVYVYKLEDDEDDSPTK